MSAETDLLPLPEPFAWVNPHDAEDFIDGEDHHFTALRRGVPDGDFPIYSAEQVRACVSSATAPLQAEIEALRAEVERLQEIVRPRREDECLTLDHWRMRAYYLERNWARCSHACAVEQDKREQAEARAERLAELLDQAYGYVPAGTLADQIHCALAAIDRARGKAGQEVGK